MLVKKSKFESKIEVLLKKKNFFSKILIFDNDLDF